MFMPRSRKEPVTGAVELRVLTVALLCLQGSEFALSSAGAHPLSFSCLISFFFLCETGVSLFMENGSHRLLVPHLG